MDFEKLHKKAAKRKNSFVEARIGQTLNDICRNPKVKAPIRYLMSGLVAKIEKPEEILFIASVRSFAQSQMDMMYNKIRCICEMGGLSLSERIGA